jgi:DNA polymerase
MSNSQNLQHVHAALRKKFSNRKLIFGNGVVGSKICFIIDFPDPEGVKEGKPLGSNNKKLLNKILRSLGLDVKKTYITSVVKYYPDGKKPSPKEIKSYVPFLKEEIKTIGPKVVVTLGDIALNSIGLRQPLSNIHGRVFNFGSYSLLPTYHPESALKDSNIHNLLQLDLLRLKNILTESEKKVV